MAAHHLGDGRGVGRTAGRCLDSCRDFAERVGTKNARGDDCEHLGVGGVAVVEAMDRPRGMHSTSPAPTPICRPSTVKVSMPLSP
jgi:hypothetical protein